MSRYMGNALNARLLSRKHAVGRPSVATTARVSAPLLRRNVGDLARFAGVYPPLAEHGFLSQKAR